MGPRDMASSPRLVEANSQACGEHGGFSWLYPAFWMGFPVAQLVKYPPAMRETWVGEIPWRRERQPPPVFLGFPGGSTGKESACKAGDAGSVPGVGRTPAEGNGYPLQYSGLENSTNCLVHGVTKSRTRLSDFHFHSDSQFL